MSTLFKAVPLLLLAAAALAQSPAGGDPWTRPRDLSAFQFLLDRSPFSLPTAEESSPLADRYTLTGAAALDGEALVFVLDKTTQERHILSKIPNRENMGLVEYLPDPDPRRMRATIRVNGQLATISYAETQPVPGQAGIVPPQPGPGQQNPSAVVNPPPGPTVAAGAPAIQQQSNNPPNRRIVRRRIISGQPPAGP